MDYYICIIHQYPFGCTSSFYSSCSYSLFFKFIIKSLFKTSSSKRRRLGERSIVRPVFSYYGKLVIDDSVIKSIVHIVAEKLEEVYRVGTTHVKHLVNGDDDLGIMVTIEVVFSYGHAIAETMAALRKDLQVEIERMTGMVVHEIDILVKSLHVDKAIAARA